jgi:hypothetical protein
MDTVHLPEGGSDTVHSRHEFEKGLQPFITNSLLQRIAGQLDDLVREIRILRGVMTKESSGRN